MLADMMAAFAAEQAEVDAGVLPATAFHKTAATGPAAVGLPASTPERTRDDGTLVPSVKGVRLHDYGDLRVVPTFGERCCRPG
jgi:hypothetical protein